MSAPVIPLPTAATRKVRQRWSKVRKADLDALLRFPQSRSLAPWQREALNSAKLVRDLERTPELLIVTAIFRALGDLDRIKVQAFIAMAAEREGHIAVRALEWLKVVDGDKCARDVNVALSRLERGEWE